MGSGREAPGAEDWVRTEKAGGGLCAKITERWGGCREERVTEYGGDWAGSGRQIEEKKGDGRVESLRGAQQR